MKSKSLLILEAMPVEEIFEFLDQCEYLRDMMRKYQFHKITDDDPDELMASSIAYHLSRLVDKFGHSLKKVEPYRHYWREINYEAWDDKKVPGKGKTLC